ncbi:MAG: SIMPL domain-containing protein [Oscillospiraceae bacterium]|nr:SIMPL domain-containing protein [Oscillospiraceae bacterium]
MKKSIAAAVCAAIILALVLGLTGCGAASSAVVTPAAAAAETVPQITVSASASVKLVPDKATVSFGVTTQEKTPEQAQSKNSEAVQKVMDVLTGRGIEEKSIRTDSYSMYPQYDWSENGDQRIIGYVVTTSMTVKDQDIADLGKLLSACVEAGINDVDSVRFLCSGYDEAYREALKEAVALSRDEAEAMAAGAGKKLGDPISITEGYQDTSSRYGKTANVYTEEAVMDAAAPSFSPGETEITANVTVTYNMK